MQPSAETDRALLIMAGDLFDPPDCTAFQADFDAVRMRGGFGQDVLDNSCRQFSGALILL